MAVLASKAPYPASLSNNTSQSSQYSSNAASYRIQSNASKEQHGFFASPTESEFSEHYDHPNPVRHWDEDRVAEWLRAINCAQYIELFRRNHINGELLMEMDQTNLKDMGIKKVGDRVRIGSQAKLFRNKEYKRASKRNSNRESLALLDNPPYTPPSSASPRPLHSARSNQSSRSEKRSSRYMGDITHAQLAAYSKPQSSSRPNSPYVDQENRGAQSSRYGAMSPKKDLSSTMSTAVPQSARTVTGRMPITPVEAPHTARFASSGRTHNRSDSNVTNSAILPQEMALIRVIFDDGRSSVVSIESCKTAEEIMLKTLRKAGLEERHTKNYCFYVLDGTNPNPDLCRRLNDVELVRVCTDGKRMERGRLMLRKIHAGGPEPGEQLQSAASIATQQIQHNGYAPNNERSQKKLEHMMGESLAPLSYPQSPSSVKDRARASQEPERNSSTRSSASARVRRIKELHGGRPPSELIASDLSTYFPDFQKDEIDKTVRMSIRRSRRISRATSRLSTVSNFSVASSLRDAPPLPAISDAWLGANQQRGLRPLSVLRLGSGSNYRDSVASSTLEPLDEESPLEPDRKSYVSFAGSDAGTLSVTDPDGRTTLQSYYDDTGSSVANSSLSGDNGDSLNRRLSQIIQEDSEESDEELEQYLEADSWENVKYMKGALIGQGSFGSVYLALHAVTGELMAVKQVEMPSSSGTQLDQKKNNMVEALKHEIGLLRDLKHPNIVQYLGSNSDDTHLNIFLEYVPGGSVATMLVNYGPLGEGLIANFVRQILNGLAYLHSKDIIHRDIKGANILVDNKGSVKISDFGISKRVEASTLLQPGGGAGKRTGPRVSLQGSVFWMAPEVVKQTAYTRKADIWSLGCLIVEMFTGHHPHPNCTQLQAIFKIGGSGDASPTIPDNASDEVKAFLKKTFEIDHEKRPTADELLQSPFCAVKA